MTIRNNKQQCLKPSRTFSKPNLPHGTFNSPPLSQNFIAPPSSANEVNNGVTSCTCCLTRPQLSILMFNLYAKNAS